MFHHKLKADPTSSMKQIAVTKKAAILLFALTVWGSDTLVPADLLAAEKPITLREQSTITPSRDQKRDQNLKDRRQGHRLIRRPSSAPDSSVAPTLNSRDSVKSRELPTVDAHGTGTKKDEVRASGASLITGGFNPATVDSVSTSKSMAVVTPTPAPSQSVNSFGAASSTRSVAAAGSSSSSSMGGLQRLLSSMPQLSSVLTPETSAQLNQTPASPPTPSSPAIVLSPGSLSFQSVAGSGNPPGQSIAVSNGGNGSLSWSTSDNASWLSVSPASGSGNGTIMASVSTAGLAAGTYNGTITVSASGASNSPRTIPVSLTVTAAPTPTIGLSPTTVTFGATQGGANPANQSLTISNTGTGTLNWTVSDNANWLTLSPSSGTGNGTVTMSVNSAGLAVGTYNGTITVSATGATNTPRTVPVSLTVTAAPAPTIGVSPSSLTFAANQGGANPANQSLSISNTGTGTLNWTASDNATWLTLSPGSGNGNGTVTVSPNITGLTAGTYNATITVSGTGATNSPTIPVTLTITNPPSIGVAPTNLSFAATQGGANPGSQTISVSNTGGGTLTWSASDNASWLSLSATSGTGNGTIAASVNTAGLAAGSYNATITVAAPGVTSRTVTVALTVNSPPTSSVTLTWNQNSESDLAGYKVYRSTTPGVYGAPIATLQGNVATYQATGLQAGTTYFFVVTAYDTSGNESGFSNEVSRSF